MLSSKAEANKLCALYLRRCEKQKENRRISCQKLELCWPLSKHFCLNEVAIVNRICKSSRGIYINTSVLPEIELIPKLHRFFKVYLFNWYFLLSFCSRYVYRSCIYTVQIHSHHWKLSKLFTKISSLEKSDDPVLCQPKPIWLPASRACPAVPLLALCSGCELVWPYTEPVWSTKLAGSYALCLRVSWLFSMLK